MSRNRKKIRKIIMMMPTKAATITVAMVTMMMERIWV